MALYKSEMEEELKKSELKYRLLINTIPNIVFKGYVDWSVDFFDNKIEALTGYTADDFAQRRVKWSDCIVAEDIPAAQEAFIRALKTTKSYLREYRIKNKEGAVFWVSEAASIVLDKENRVEYISGAFLDVTKRKGTELALQKAQETLVYSEKLAAIGRLASGVAHEVKNPLGIIMGGLEYLEQKLSSADEETRSDMKKVREAVKRADAVIQGLLKFSRPADLKIEKINLNDMVNNVIALLQYKTQLAKIKVCTELSGGDTTVSVDRAQIEQVLINVLLNAVEAMPLGGLITVTSGSGIIEIRDMGEGISAHDLAKLFEPFFTTKRDKKGTGLGLYISRMIVENHRGKMAIESELGKGTLVRIMLPAGA